MSAQRCIAGSDGGRERLALYLLGSLPADEEFEVEAHLLRCAACRATTAALSEVAVSVVTLPASTVRELEADGPDADAGLAAGTEPRLASPAGGPVARSGAGPRARRRNRFRRALGYAVVLLVGAVLGAGGLAVVRGGGAAPTAVGSEPSGAAGGQLSVTVTDRADGGVEVRGIVSGMRPGVGFELVAVGAGDRVHLVVSGVADGGRQTVLGGLAVPRPDIRFFVLSQPGAGVLLVAPVP
ncbi:zf-HC2 domain-containing protein [Micromonospora sp. NPDC051296]|uniref:zf-HC2 domain-containing protein n=1 Tax=Micromonospora sp. NPDC051296 TaxID=3155046 RepID=UPI0034273E88